MADIIAAFNVADLATFIPVAGVTILGLVLALKGINVVKRLVSKV